MTDTKSIDPKSQGNQGHPHQSIDMIEPPMVGKPSPFVSSGQQGMQITTNTTLVQQDNAVLRRAGFQTLNEKQGIFIEQEYAMGWDNDRGCGEDDFYYYVYGSDQNGKKEEEMIFQGFKKSADCEHCCQNHNCRSFNLTVFESMDGENLQEPFLTIKKPCRCTLFCFNRSEVLLNLVEGGRTDYLGKIMNPWNCCNMELNVYDKNNIHKYNIKGKCCQWGFWCSKFCKSFQINFDVTTPSGEVLCHFKKTNGCFTYNQNAVALFPRTTTSDEKALLLSAYLFLDYRYFETFPGIYTSECTGPGGGVEIDNAGNKTIKTGGGLVTVTWTIPRGSTERGITYEEAIIQNVNSAM